ncbi:MAG: Uma2 family endonuclease [Armatimonadetes bacterium]|nr:Uma2 family endonuclease [Armatimonadota bacterium]
MAVTANKKAWADEELLQIKHEGKVELVDGEVKLMTPAGLEQGWINARLTVKLGSYILRHGLGFIFDARTGFRLRRNMRAPDFSFVSREKLPHGKLPKGFGRVPPDLAVEVLGLNETLDDYEEKIAEYLSWGVRLIWLVDPNAQRVVVIRQNGERQVLNGNDVLSGEDVVPGFRVRVKTLFS